VKQALLEKVEELTAHLEERVKMSLPTKITMLGTTGAGKTCYMIGMHMYMQTCGTNGFTITSCQHNQARQIEEQWDKMTESEGTDRWPPGNPDVPIEYSFNFNYASQTFAQFDWLDYRGGALKDNADAEDSKILVERLCTSDCVFLCLPAEYLLSGSRYKAAAKAGVGRMNTLMTEVAAKVNPTPENPFPVAIIVTKADLLGEFDGSLESNAIDAVKAVFQSLFVPESPWLVSIIGVSLGQELAQKPESGEIDPIAVHLPVTFAVLCKLLKQKQTVAKPKRDLSWLGSVLDLTLRDPQQVEKKIQQLDQELADVTIYAGNQRVQGLLWPDK
jgi:hypothetical protein